uniref:Uncharacterized protein n=1 Tax=Rhabditophanes sp. KR3021 TaxID=114890 RepID=A0AC35U3E0_9BILA
MFKIRVKCVLPVVIEISTPTEEPTIVNEQEKSDKNLNPDTTGKPCPKVTLDCKKCGTNANFRDKMKILKEHKLNQSDFYIYFLYMYPLFCNKVSLLAPFLLKTLMICFTYKFMFKIRVKCVLPVVIEISTPTEEPTIVDEQEKSDKNLKPDTTGKI